MIPSTNTRHAFVRIGRSLTHFVLCGMLFANLCVWTIVADHDHRRIAQASVNGFGAKVTDLGVYARDIAFDRSRGLLYATTAEAGSPGRLQILDTTTFSTTNSISLGELPGRLALSDDDRYLYVSLEGPRSIKRIDLSSQSSNLEFSVGSLPIGTPCGGSMMAEDLDAVPGMPESVAVSRRQFSCSPWHADVAIFDNGVMRSQTASSLLSGNSIAFGSTSDTLYGLANESMFMLATMLVSPAGVTVTRTTVVPAGYFAELEYTGGLLYLSSGAVINPADASQVGSYALPVSGGSYRFTRMAAPQPNESRVFFVNEYPIDDVSTLYIFDRNQFQLLQKTRLTGVKGEPRRLVQISPDTLVLATESYASGVTHRLYLIKLINAQNVVVDAGADITVRLQPGGNPAHVALSANATSDPLAGTSFLYNWSASSSLSAGNESYALFYSFYTGIFTVAVTATDGLGQVSAPDTLTITVLPPLNVYAPATFNRFKPLKCLPTLLETFETPTDAFQDGSGTEASFKYVNGAYRLLTYASYIIAASPDWGLPADFVTGVDVWSIANVSKTDMGLVFGLRQPYPGLWSTWYTFSIDPAGRSWRVQKWQNGYPTGSLLTSGTANAINSDSSVRQRLEVKQTGNRTTLIINGQVVGSLITEAFDSRTSNGIVLMNPNLDYRLAYFDNLQATALSGGCVNNQILPGSGTTNKAYEVSSR